MLGAAATSIGGCVNAVNARRQSTPAPQPAEAPIEIKFSPWYTGAPWKTVQPLMQEVLAGFEQANPGLRIVLQDPPGGCCNAGGLAAAVIGGDAPDVVLNNNFGPLAEGGYLLRLNEYLDRDNVDVSLWSKLQMASFQTSEGLYALPTYFNTTCYFVNLSTFDELGLPYPDPGWTHMEFLKTAQALAGESGGKPRFGCNLWWWTGQAWGSDWIFHGFGGAKVDGTGTRCLLDRPAAVAAGEWIYNEILWPGVGTAQDTFGGYAAQFASGQTVMSVQQTGTLFGALVGFANNGMKWDLYPFPVFPAGRAAFGGDQFYAINAHSPHPDHAWALLKWICAESTWQQAMIRLFLMAPALNSLWSEWTTIVRAVAPPLNNKALQWFTDPAVQGYAMPTGYFQTSDTQAETIIQAYYADLYARRAGSVQAAFTQAAHQVNALEDAAPAQAAAKQAAASAFPTIGPALAPVQPGL